MCGVPLSFRVLRFCFFGPEPQRLPFTKLAESYIRCTFRREEYFYGCGAGRIASSGMRALALRYGTGLPSSMPAFSGRACSCRGGRCPRRRGIRLSCRPLLCGGIFCISGRCKVLPLLPQLRFPAILPSYYKRNVIYNVRYYPCNGRVV